MKTAQIAAGHAKSFSSLSPVEATVQSAPGDTVIAIVDDDEMVRRSASLLLEQAGYRIRTFESGDAFLAAQRPGDSDCVLLDMRMPGTDGLGVLRALGTWETMPPVLVLTAHGAVPEAVEAMKLGAADFLAKPYPAEALLSAIGAALESASASVCEAEAGDVDAVAKVGQLSPRQGQVLRGVLMGRPNKVIAYELGLSVRTVEAYRAQSLDKLGVRGIAEALRLAIAAGILEG
jgi:two-component system response regulator FixJ